MINQALLNYQHPTNLAYNQFPAYLTWMNAQKAWEDYSATPGVAGLETLTLGNLPATAST